MLLLLNLQGSKCAFTGILTNMHVDLNIKKFIILKMVNADDLFIRVFSPDERGVKASVIKPATNTWIKMISCF